MSVSLLNMFGGRGAGKRGSEGGVVALALGVRVLGLGPKPMLGWSRFWAGLCPRAREPLHLLGEEGGVRTAC